MNDEQRIILCPKCGGAYFLEPRIWTPDGEKLAINVNNPLTLICAKCGVCLQFIDGGFQWIQQGRGGHEGTDGAEDAALKKKTEEQWLDSREN